MMDISNIIEALPIGIISFDGNGIINNVNSNLFKFNLIKEYNNGNILGANIFEIDLFEDFNLSIELQKIKSGFSFEKTVKRFQTLSGDEISIIVKGAALIEEGKIAGGILLIEDMQTEGELHHYKVFSDEYFATALKEFCDYFLIADSSGLIKYIPERFSLKKIKFLIQKQMKINELFSTNISNEIDEIFGRLKVSDTKIVKEFLLNNVSEEINLKLTFIKLFGNSVAENFVLILFNEMKVEKKDLNNRNEIDVPGDEKLKMLETEIEELRSYESIITSIVTAVFKIDTNLEICFWNRGAEKIFEYSRSEIFGKKISRILQGFTAEFIENLKTELQNEESFKTEIKLSSSDKKIKYIELTIFKVKESDEIIFLCNDVTDRKINENQLRKSEELFRSIVTNSTEYICILNLDGSFSYINPALKNFLQLEETEIEKLNFIDLIEPEFKTENDLTFGKLYSDKKICSEIPLVNKENSKIIVQASINQILDFNNRPLSYNLILSDITEKKENENRLLLSQSIIETSIDGILLQTQNKLIFANKSLAKIFGYDAVDEIKKKNLLDFVSPKSRVKVSKIYKEILQGNSKSVVYDFIGKRKDNTEMFLEASVSTYISDGETFIVSIFRDISGQREAQAALAISEERYRSITENIDEFIWTSEIVDGKLKMFFVTPAVKKITGYTTEEFISDQRLWLRIVHPNDSKDLFKRLKRLYRNSLKNSDEFDYRIINSEGNVVWIQNKITIKRNAVGKIVNVFGLVSDITPRKRAEAELQKFNENLKNLNETKDRFLSIISHDLRTPFSSILGFTDILLSDDSLEADKQREYIKFIQESSRNMLSLVNSLLDWTRLQTGRIKFSPEKINAKILVGKILQMLTGTAIQKELNLVNRIEEDLIIFADQNLIMQLISNLLSNAIKFTAKGGEISVRAIPKIDKGVVEFKISDTGTGIKEEDLPKLFNVDTKFTLKGTEGEQGSGLGLSLCKDIVEKHNGKIWVESQLGKGSDFYFTIPVSSQNILLIESGTTDRILYKKLIKNILPDYDVISVNNFDEAFDTIETKQPPLIISNHKIQQKSAYDLLQKIDARIEMYSPGFILLCDSINSSVSEDFKEIGIEYVFTKPVNINSFKFAIDESLKKSFFRKN